MKNCLISGRYLDSQYKEEHAAVSVDLIRYLGTLGFVSRPIWDELFTKQRWEVGLKGVDLVVLSGGESLGVDERRDTFELGLLQKARSAQVPVLGICRGMQIMMVHEGLFPHELPGHAGTRHNNFGVISGEVNSFHHHGFNSFPPGFELVSEAEDSSIEAVHHRENNWLGVMWHPEREQPMHESQSNIILEILGLQ